MVDCEKRLVEVDEVLNYLSSENIEKIPEGIRNLIKENKDKEYTWKYDETKKLKDQNLSEDTIILLAYLNNEYLLNEAQKDLMEQIYEFNEKKEEKNKKEKYNPNNMFNSNNTENLKGVKQTQETQLVESKDNIFKRIIAKIKSFFGLKESK